MIIHIQLIGICKSLSTTHIVSCDLLSIFDIIGEAMEEEVEDIKVAVVAMMEVEEVSLEVCLVEVTEILAF